MAATQQITPLNIQIAKLRAEGKSFQAIGDEVGMTKGAIKYRVDTNESVQKFIKDCHNKLLKAALPKAIENINNVVQVYTESEDAQTREHGFKASLKLAESVGMLPSHSQATLVQQNFVQVNNYVSPAIADALKQLGMGELPVDNLVDDGVIDVESYPQANDDLVSD